MSNNENVKNEREVREDEMHELYSEEEMSRMTVAEVLQIEARFGLYCGTCGHGNGCEHGVPVSR